MADTATEAMVAKLRRGPIPRRSAPIDTASLFHADACALLHGEALARIPGVDAIHPDAGFLNWECRWRSTTGPTSLLLLFDRNDPLTAEDGQPTRLGGHDGFVAPGGYGDETCRVQVVHRAYRVESSTPAVELLLVVVFGKQPPAQLCAMATDLAASAAASLPAR